MKLKVKALTVVISVLILALAVAAGCQRADVEQAAAVDETGSKDTPATVGAPADGSTSPEKGAGARAGGGTAVAKAGGAEARAGNGKAQAGDAVAGDGKARGGDVVAGEGGAAAGAGPGKVSLKVNGEPGTSFSGTCVVGGEEREVSGQVPGRFVYEPEGRKVECEIRKGGSGAGPLKFFIDARGGNKKQKIKVTGDNIDFTFSGDGISYTTSSASGAAVQKSEIKSSSSSTASSSSKR